MNDRVVRLHCSNGFCKFDSYTTTNIQTKYDEYWIILITKINNMFKVKQNDKFSQPMNKQELYQTTKMGKSMKMTPFLIELQQAKQLFEECGFQYKAKAKLEVDKLLNNSTKLVSEYDKISFDKWMGSLIAKNGTTNY